jgi:hypothetical protein
VIRRHGAGFVRGLLLAAALAACAREDVELASPEHDAAISTGAGRGTGAAGRAAGTSGAAGRAGDGGRDAGAADDDAALPVEPPPPTALFDRGLCVCTSATFEHAFSIDAFDSREGPYTQSQSGASVGVDDQLISTAAVDIRGALTAAGSGILPITTGPFHVEGKFETNSALTITAPEVRFDDDLWVNGDIVTLGNVRVAGDVYQTAGHTGAEAVSAGGQLHTQDFVVEPPCGCGGRELLDIDAIVAAGASDNDNARLGLTRDALHTAAASGKLELACGRLAFEGGNVVAGSAVDARGHVVLFVSGDLTIAGSFATQLGTDGELDVFVRGNLILLEGAQVGTIARPAALRFYVSGEGDIAVTGPLSFAANLYAPRTNLYLTVDQRSYGALFVKTYQGIADHVMHYDRAVAGITPNTRGTSCSN